MRSAENRYLQLNPLQVMVVPDRAALDRYPWTGYSALLGQTRQVWQSVDAILGQFVSRRREARRRFH